MKNTIAFVLCIYIVSSCSEKKTQIKDDFIIAHGQMPNITRDKDNAIHLVYGNGDSIMYASSTDNGSTFSRPSLISNLAGVYSFAMRGPQIACTDTGIVVTACSKSGNIYSFFKNNGANWMQGKNVNDVDTIAKEGLMALGADGVNAFAVWLDLRGNHRNKIYGAQSTDAGKTWSKNIMVYTSPDTTVCECCKPSVVVKGDHIYVMFRNQLQGNRDLYITESGDGGNTFSDAKKLGNGNWKLNGCPMDGGGLAVDDKGEVHTVWRRESKIYTAIQAMPEMEIGEGKGCTMDIVNNKNVYAWVENGSVVIVKPQGQKVVIGKGSQPVLKAVDDEHILCVWENEKHIHAAVIKL
ncbi:MAG: sialidase family protein [Ferruginibacter sp.]